MHKVLPLFLRVSVMTLQAESLVGWVERRETQQLSVSAFAGLVSPAIICALGLLT
jgi:hypothetical protein